MFRKFAIGLALLLCAMPTWAATLYVEEFPLILPAYYQAAVVPSIASQTIAIGGSSIQSASFNVSTVLIRVHTDAICSIQIGSSPTATTTNMRLAANQTEYFVVPKGTAFKIAVISNT